MEVIVYVEGGRHTVRVREGLIGSRSPLVRQCRRATPIPPRPGSRARVRVLRLLPGQHRVAFVVEDEVAAVGADHHDRVTLAFLVDDDRHADGAPWQAGIDKHLALEELIVLAVALAVAREIPAVDDAPVLGVGGRLDLPVHLAVGGRDKRPDFRG